MQMSVDDNTQSTVYEPLLQAFATLTPVNTAARVAFSDVFESANLSQKQQKTEYPHHGQFMHVNQEPEYDREVALLRTRHDDGSVSDTPTDPDTESEPETTDAGRIWTGCYFFQMSVLPRRPEVGWLAGKGRLGEEPEFLLATRQRSHGIRGRHAFFMFNSETRFLSISRASRAANDIYVDGIPITNQIAFNKSEARIRIGQLEYLFKYTEFSRDEIFYQQRDELLSRIFGWSNLILPSVTPTPAPHSIAVGEWTLAASAGKGGFGKVSVATNTSNEVVAIKMMERSARTASHIAQEIATLQKITDLVNREREDRIVRLREVIYQHGKEQYSPPRLEEVSLVLEPVVRQTFAELITSGALDPLTTDADGSSASDNLLILKLHLLHEAVLGLQFLHNNGWIHGDIKPQNIGIEHNSGSGAASALGRVVLLDVGDALRFRKGEKVPVNPGSGGTVNYLAPEREMLDFDETVDVWAMGVVGYELVYGKHPFRFSKNPWRKGREYEGLRDYWHGKYEVALERLRDEGDCKHPYIGNFRPFANKSLQSKHTASPDAKAWLGTG